MKLNSFTAMFAFVSVAACTKASAAPLGADNVGNFGGFRIWTACALGTVQRHCAIDTGSEISIADDEALFSHYPVLSSAEASGISSVDFAGVIVQLTDLFFADQKLRPTPLLKSGTFSKDISPMVGLAAIDGLKLMFDFQNSTLTTLRNAPSPTFPLLRGNFGGRGLLVSAAIGECSELVAIDTGSPVTLVDTAFAAHHPELFQPSTIAVSNELRNAGISAYQILKPIVVGGLALQADFVEVTDLSAFDTGTTKLNAILGANHLVKANWFFDLSTNQFAVARYR